MATTGIKICGVTRRDDAELAIALGADFIGLNFWPRSSRFVDLGAAESIAAAVSGRAKLVGLWVDPEPREVADTASRLPLDLFQFHGEVGSRALERFPGRVIRAIRLGSDPHPIDLTGLEEVWGFLFDCAPDGVYGGTGVSWSYERIAGLETGKPTLLAGGLDPDNVAAAIACSEADIVDVCSGVEVAPGIKDAALLRRFIWEVRNV